MGCLRKKRLNVFTKNGRDDKNTCVFAKKKTLRKANRITVTMSLALKCREERCG